jgi:hypothetical protein
MVCFFYCPGLFDARAVCLHMDVRGRAFMRRNIATLSRVRFSAKGFQQRLVTGRKLFQKEWTAAVHHFQSKIEEKGNFFCAEMQQLKDECTALAIDEILQYMKSNEVCQNCEGGRGAKLRRRIPELLPKWNARRPMTILCDMTAEIKRIVPNITVLALLRYWQLICPRGPVQRIAEKQVRQIAERIHEICPKRQSATFFPLFTTNLRRQQVIIFWSFADSARKSWLKSFPH